MEDFTTKELETKMLIQKVMMDIFGYVYDDKKLETRRRTIGRY